MIFQRVQQSAKVRQSQNCASGDFVWLTKSSPPGCIMANSTHVAPESTKKQEKGPKSHLIPVMALVPAKDLLDKDGSVCLGFIINAFFNKCLVCQTILWSTFSSESCRDETCCLENGSFSQWTDCKLLLTPCGRESNYRSSANNLFFFFLFPYVRFQNNSDS